MRAAFDRGYKESLFNVEIDDFLDNGCAITGTQLTNAVLAGCRAAVAHLDQDQPDDPETIKLRSQLCSEIVTLALGNLSIARQ